MAASGYTPILLYASGTATNVPLAANLTSSASGAELALNYADGKLFYKDSSGTVQVLAVKMPSGILPIANGGTNATATPTAGAVSYGTGTAYAFTSAGTSNQVLISNGSSAPSWSNLSSLGVTSLSFGTTGLTPSTATQGAITVAGTLATTNGGTGLTSFTANGVVYASSTSALATGSALTFDGTSLSLGNSGTLKIYDQNSITFGVFNNGSSGTLLQGGTSTSFLTYVNGILRQEITNTGVSIWSVAGSEQMRLTSTGLGIGTSSPSAKLDIQGGSITVGTTTAGNSTVGMTFGKVAAGGGTISNRITLATYGGAYGAYMEAYADLSASTATYLAFGTTPGGGGSPLERARIDSSGNLLVGTTSADPISAQVNGLSIRGAVGDILASAGDTPVLQIARRGSDGGVIQFYKNTTAVGSVSTTSVLTTYNTTSDYRLKTVLGPVSDAGSRIDALEPVEYEWKSEGSRTRGFLAHKFQEVYAGSVNGSKDAVDAEGKPVYQSMQASSSEVIADLVAEIQSLRKRLAAAGI